MPDLLKYVEEQGQLVIGEDDVVAECGFRALETLVNKCSLNGLMSMIRDEILSALAWAAKRAG